MLESDIPSITSESRMYGEYSKSRSPSLVVTEGPFFQYGPSDSMYALSIFIASPRFIALSLLVWFPIGPSAAVHSIGLNLTLALTLRPELIDMSKLMSSSVFDPTPELKSYHILLLITPPKSILAAETGTANNVAIAVATTKVVIFFIFFSP